MKASNTDANDHFGEAVAIDGDTLVVGAGWEQSPSTGVNGAQGNAPGSSLAGAAYVFVRSQGVWVQQAYLKASNTGFGDLFGEAVAISGDTIVIGAPDERSAATGVDGDQTDNSRSGAGAVYVFVRSGTTWTQQAYLKASNTDVDDEFGSSVSISGDTIVVGAPFEDSWASSVNGDQNNNNFQWAGAAYVFVRNGTTWTQEAYLKPSFCRTLDRFGHSVAIDGDTIVAGAYGDDSSATGVNGDGTIHGANDSGAAYVFVRSGTTWSQEAYLKASNTEANDLFGIGVAVSGDTIAVAARTEDSSATGVDGDQADNSAPSAGAVYVYTRIAGTWSQQAYVKASNAEAGDQFGGRLALRDDLLLVVASTEDSAATGWGGDQSDNSAFESGATYLFERRGANWSQIGYLKATNTEASDSFGSGVALSGDRLLVGALREESSAVGVDGDQSDNSAGDAGAAYLYDLGWWEHLPGCHGNSARFRVPSKLARIDSAIAVELTGHLVQDGLAAVFHGARGVDALGCGLPLAAGEEVLLALTPFPVVTGIAPVLNGVAMFVIALPDNVGLVGIDVALQAIVVDTLTFTCEFSTALEFKVLP